MGFLCQVYYVWGFRVEWIFYVKFIMFGGLGSNGVLCQVYYV